MSRKNVRELALDMLMQIEENQAYSNLLLNQQIKKHDLSGKDAGLLTELVYGTVQRMAALDYFLKPFLKKGKIDKWVRMLLRLSIYQMIFLDRIPDRAVIHEAVEIAKRRGHRGISGMVNGVLRNIQREGVPSFEDIKDPQERLSVETGHPLWLIKRWTEQFGFDETKKMCEINLTPPTATARVNVDKGTVEDVIQMLADEGIEAQPGDLSLDAIKVKSGSLANTKAFKEGYITVQDESSMLVARALGPSENDTVLDSCAAPGGKSTHLAERMHNTGKVISLDLHKHKVKLIDEQAKRLGLLNIETGILDSRNATSEFSVESFDKILVDAPCSGLGVIRRKPDIKFGKKEEDISRLSAIQNDILDAVAPLLKKGGVLVYSTCTVDEEENGRVVEAFLQRHPDFEPDPTLMDRLPEAVRQKMTLNKSSVQILPHYFGTDGFFIASLRKRV